MSITDGLRDCIRTADRSYEDVRNPCNDREILYIPEEELLAIADRIDEQAEGEYTRGYIAGFSEASDGIEAADELRERMEREYIKAPVDAEGMPWRIGDTIEWPDGQTAEVVGISANTLFYIEHDFDNSAQWTAAHDKRHHHEPTVEDVLREFANKVCSGDHLVKDGTFIGLEDTDLLAEYAAKLRLAGEGA